MTKDELVEKCARALAHSHGLDFDEVCGVDADPDHGYCDSGTCIAALCEDHDPDWARSHYLRLARAALAIAMPAAFEMAAEVAEKVIIDARTGEIDNDLRSVSYTLVQEMRAEGEKWK